MTALVPTDAHSEMVPSSVENTKSAVPTAHVPVGVPGPVPLKGGTDTISLDGSPVPSYTVETPLPSSAAHQYEVVLRESPQGLISFGSVNAPMPAMSEVRLVCV